MSAPSSTELLPATGPGLDRLLRPSSVAVVGATDRPGSYGANTLRNLVGGRFGGRVVAVNPRRDEVFGVRCVPTLGDLAEPVDAVVVATPARTLVDQVESAAALGCGGIVAYADGFDADGLDDVQRALAATGLPLLGPNTNGVVDVRTGATLWGDLVRMPEVAGPVALVTQSGNLGVSALAHRHGLGLHSVVALGNAVALEVSDVLEHLAHADERPRAVALYLEDDGDGPRLAAALAACAGADVRVVVLKAGRSVLGRAAAAAHTEALLGPYRVFTALVQEAGGVVVDDVHDLIEVARALAAGRRDPRDVAIVTCSGGDAAVAADLAAETQLALAPLAPATRDRLRAVLPPQVTVGNPLDHGNRVWADTAAIATAVAALAGDPGVGHLLYVQDEPPDLPPDDAAEWAATRAGAVEGARRAGHEPLLVCTFPGQEPREPERPVVSGLRPALAAVAALRRPAPDPDRLRAVAAAAAAGVRGGGAGALAEHEAKRLLAAAGVDVPVATVARTVDEAVAAAAVLDGSCAVKVSAPGLMHKSAQGAVVTGLADGTAVRGAAARLLEVADSLDGGVLLVEPMAAPGVEVLVAARADGVVPVLVLATGGVWTEVLDDTVVVPLPADAARVAAAVRDLRGAALLAGHDVPALVALAVRVGRLLLERRWALVELNPVIVAATGAVAVDAVLVPG